MSNRYIGYVEVSIPVFCEASSEDEAYDKFNSNLVHYIANAINDDVAYVYDNAYLEFVEYDGPIQEQEIKEKSLNEKTVDAAVLFLVRKGYEILETNYDSKESFNIIAKDNCESSLVFINVGHSSEQIPEDNFNRSEVEKLAGKWLFENIDSLQDKNFKIRFDIINMHVVKDKQALLRHHINVGGGGC